MDMPAGAKGLLSGSKTYIAGGALIALAIDHWANGRMEQAAQCVAEGLGFIGLRLAVTPTTPAASPAPPKT